MGLLLAGLVVGSMARLGLVGRFWPPFVIDGGILGEHDRGSGECGDCPVGGGDACGGGPAVEDAHDVAPRGGDDAGGCVATTPAMPVGVHRRHYQESAVDVSGEAYVDLEMEAIAAMKRD